MARKRGFQAARHHPLATPRFLKHALGHIRHGLSRTESGVRYQPGTPRLTSFARDARNGSLQDLEANLCRVLVGREPDTNCVHG